MALDPGYSYIALKTLFINGARAFNVGMEVPDSTVTAQGWVVGTDVQAPGPIPPSAQLVTTPMLAGSATTRQLSSYDTSANWVASNPVLNANERGFATDTGVEKVGDGVKTWTALPQVAAATFASSTETYIDKQAGADPTGVADSTAAFQAALNALPTVTVWSTSPTVPGKPGGGGTGTSATYRIGTIRLGSGTYKIGTSGDIGNLGPFVSVIGPGRSTCTLDYRGTGDCLRASGTVRPNSGTFFELAGMGGIFNGFTIAGENAGVGATGLHIGDSEGFELGPDLYVRNFTGTIAAPVIALGASASTGGTFAGGAVYWKVTATTGTTNAIESVVSNQITTTVAANGTQQITWSAVTGATGYTVYRSIGSTYYVVAQTTATSYTDTGSSLSSGALNWPAPPGGGACGILFDNMVMWTENITGRATVYNCSNAVMFYGANLQGTTGGYSFMYNDLSFKIQAFQQQNGVVFANGATYQGGRLSIRANMQNNAAATANALLVLTGKTPAGRGGAGSSSAITNSYLYIGAETDGGNANNPQTVRYGDPGSGQNSISNCSGGMTFTGGWTASNYAISSTAAAPQFQFLGPVVGDASLAPGAGFNVAGALKHGRTTLFSSGTINMDVGDFAGVFTLSANLTIAFSGTKAGPQVKVIPIKQAATGGPWTVTWPHNASPTLASPTVLWAGGTAPTQTATAGALDVYELVTWDGVTFLGRFWQNIS